MNLAFVGYEDLSRGKATWRKGAWNHYKKGAITIPGNSAEVSTVRWGNLDEDVVVSFPYFREHGPVTLQVTEPEPYDFFSLLFPEELWDVLVEQTNIYVAQKQRKSWFNETNKDEMKAFVGTPFFYGCTQAT